MNQTYTKVVVTGSGPQGTALSLTIDFSPDATGPRRYGQRWHRCVLCGFDYPRSKVIMYQGKPYGVPCGDYKDINRLVQR